jgi:hypothetical protein
MDSTEFTPTTRSVSRALQICTREMTMPRQIRWTAINSPHPSSMTTVTFAPQQAMSMFNTDTSASHSKFRDQILESASRIAAIPRPKANKRKRKAPATPRRKRPVPLALDPKEDSSAGDIENDGSPRPTKTTCTQNAKDASRPLSITSSSRVNSTTAETPKVTASATGDPRQGTSRILMMDQDIQTQCAAVQDAVQVVKHAIAQPPPMALHVENEISNPQQRLLQFLEAHVDNAIHAVSSLLTSSAPAPSSSIDGIDYLDEDESPFHALPDPRPTHGTTYRSYESADLDPKITPLNKMLAAQSYFRNPAPSSLISNEGSSPASTCMTPITPSTVLKPFMRSPLCIEMISTLPELPSINTERRTPTCFRIAEVLRLQAMLSEPATAQTTMVELYAKIVGCSRKDNVQTIQFADLFFPGRPPYLTGTRKIISDDTVFDIDGASPLTKPTKAISQGQPSNNLQSYKLCRAIAELKPSPVLPSSRTRQTLEVDVLSIWETDWEDVERVRGIVDPEHQAQGLGSSMSSQRVTNSHEGATSKRHAESVDYMQIVRTTEVL